MKILVSNDDGYQAPGIICLAQMLTSLDFVEQVSVVAPDSDRSGASHSLTLTTPLRAKARDNGFISVNGTPTDCVHLAITGLMEDQPDMVISGINAGGNLGDDVLYSGTVAAAMEGRFLGLPAIAVSLAALNAVHSVPSHYATAAAVVKTLLQRLRGHPLPQDTILNVNVPDVPYAELNGMMATRLGHRHKSEPVIEQRDPRGDKIYWVGPPGAAEDAGAGTDFHAISHKQVSVTPLQIDLTRHSALEELAGWVRGGG